MSECPSLFDSLRMSDHSGDILFCHDNLVISGRTICLRCLEWRMADRTSAGGRLTRSSEFLSPAIAMVDHAYEISQVAK
jgi:hypothetical protein